VATGADTGSSMDAPSLTAEAGTDREEGKTMSERVGSGNVAGERPRSSNGQKGWTGVLKEAATSRLSDQKHRASEGIDGVARALRDTTDKLSGEGRTAVADYARQAASQLERFSRRLDEQDLDEMLRGAQRFARSQPWVFVAAAFGVGLITARFFKSSTAPYSARGTYGSEWRQQGGGASTYATSDFDRPAYGTPGQTGPAYGTGPTS
jgi:ElaB/YqjD/DUF883 family membrane-anchored ribosome-binding protein